ARDGVLRRILPERAEELALEVPLAPEPGEPVHEAAALRGQQAPERVCAAEEAELVVPRVGEEELVQLGPALGDVLAGHECERPTARRGCAFDVVGAGNRPCAPLE